MNKNECGIISVMNMEKIEQAFALVLRNVQLLESQLSTHFYEGLIEQNASYTGKSSLSDLRLIQDDLRALGLTKKEWQKVYQFALVKGAKAMHLQANHQLTPDAIGYIVNFMVETLYSDKVLSILELGSGTGNLAETLLTGIADKTIAYTGFEVDDLMIDLSASIADVMQTDAKFLQIDAIRPQVIDPVDLLVSDLPIGYYPDDEVAKRSAVASEDEHTYYGIHATFIRLKDAEVRDYQYAHLAEDHGLDVLGFIGDAPERGSLFLGLGREAAADRFAEVLKEAARKAKE